MSQGEREFLHDISTPLMVAQGMVSRVQKEMKDSDLESEKSKSMHEKLDKALKAIDKISLEVKRRREKIKEKS